MASWKDRLKEGAITTPDGKRYTFAWEDLERTFEKKTSEYQFSDIEGTLIRDFGVGKIDCPITIYFFGENCDTQADQFFNSAILRGNSFFESPRYGEKTVVIKGSPQRDSLLSAANQVVFNLDMTETIVVTVPESAELDKTAIAASQEAFMQANSEAFAKELNVNDTSDFLACRNRMLSFVKDLKSTFKSALNTVNEINEAFTEISDFITENIDFLLGAPLQMGMAIQRLIDAPARLSQSVNSRIDGYTESYDKMLTGLKGSGQDAKNKAVEAQLFLTGLVSGMCSVYLNALTDGLGFATKSDAVDAAQSIGLTYINTQDYLDGLEFNSLAYELSIRFSMSDSVAQSIKDITARTARELLRQSFSLKQERVYITDKDWNILDLCFFLYGTTDNDTLDFLIESNGFTGDTICKVPKDTSVLYYA